MRNLKLTLLLFTKPNKFIVVTRDISTMTRSPCLGVERWPTPGYAYYSYINVQAAKFFRFKGPGQNSYAVVSYPFKFEEDDTLDPYFKMI